MSTWNRDYDAAQMIFGPGPSCIAARAAIRLLHAQLYRRGLYCSLFVLKRQAVVYGPRKEL